LFLTIAPPPTSYKVKVFWFFFSKKNCFLRSFPLLKGIMTIGGWTMGSRVLGLIRDMLIAHFLGAGRLSDAYVVANRLPNLFRRLFGEGAFNAAFVPVFSGLLVTEGEDVARGFTEEAFAALAFWLLGLTILGEIFMRPLLHVLAAGFADDPAKFELTVVLARLAFPYLLLICLAALLSGVLNAMDRFVAAAAAPMLYNAFAIGSLFALRPFLPTSGHALAIGVSLSGVAQLALLYWAVRRSGLKLHLPRPRMTPRMRLLLRRMAPGLVGAGITQLSLAVDTVIGTYLPAKSVSFMYYADRINQLPLGVLGIAVGTALLPTLSRQVSAGENDRALASLNRAIEYAMLLTLPAAAALLIIADPILQVLFVGGKFTHADATLSAQSLAAYAAGLPAFVLIKVLGPGFFARGDMSTPVRIGMGILFLNVALSLALMNPLKHVGPPLATTLAMTVNVVLLAILLWRRGFLVPDRVLWSRLLRMLAAACVMAAVLWRLRKILVPASGVAVSIPSLVLLVAAGLASYGAAATALGLHRLRKNTKIKTV
jgi:putative peptidoglycan lipid II flippase